MDIRRFEKGPRGAGRPKAPLPPAKFTRPPRPSPQGQLGQFFTEKDNPPYPTPQYIRPYAVRGRRVLGRFRIVWGGRAYRENESAGGIIQLVDRNEVSFTKRYVGITRAELNREVARLTNIVYQLPQDITIGEMTEARLKWEQG